MNRETKETVTRAALKKLRCSSCGHHFVEGALQTDDIVGNKAIISTHCTRCNTTALVITSSAELRNRLTSRTEQAKKIEISRVNASDIVEMKQFLDAFSGNIGDMFKNHVDAGSMPKPIVNEEASKAENETGLA